MSAYAQNYPPAVVPLGINPSGEPTTFELSATGGVKASITDALPAGGNSIGAITSAQLPAALGSNGGLKVEANGAKNTATVARVSASATAVTLLAANADRKRFIIHNESSSSKLTVKFGSSASAIDYSFPLDPGDTFESWNDWIYTGIVTGIWDSATGAAQVTEI